MPLPIGMRVKVEFKDAHFGMDCSSLIDSAMSEHLYKEAGMKYFKGTIVKVYTPTWLGLFKPKSLYTVSLDLYPEVNFKASKVKRIINELCSTLSIH